jgi:hypothetical protein
MRRFGPQMFWGSKETRRLGYGRCLMHATEPLQPKTWDGIKENNRQKRGKWDQQKPKQIAHGKTPARRWVPRLLLRDCQAHTNCWGGWTASASPC